MKSRQPPTAIIVVLLILAIARCEPLRDTIGGLGTTGWGYDPETAGFPQSNPTADAPADGALVSDELAASLPPLDPTRHDEALDVIDRLRTAPPGPTGSYDRDLFGQAWTDDVPVTFGHNGCDTRNDILRRDLEMPQAEPGTRDCVIVAGTFHEPYTGAPTVFAKAAASEVHIDHVVPLSAAWQMGAARWDDEQRRMFANDPLNLLAVDGSANQAKSDSTPADWLPDNVVVRCSYVVRYAEVSLRYDLPVTSNDKAAMSAQCGG